MILAQAVQSGRIILLIGLAIVALILFGLVVLQLRRRLFGGGVEEGEAFDMETLQRQHRAGKITDEEFKTLRRALLGLPAEDARARREVDASGERGPDEPGGS